jgi:hypothetical protein
MDIDNRAVTLVFIAMAYFGEICAHASPTVSVPGTTKTIAMDPIEFDEQDWVVDEWTCDELPGQFKKHSPGVFLNYQRISFYVEDIAATYANWHLVFSPYEGQKGILFNVSQFETHETAIKVMNSSVSDIFTQSTSVDDKMTAVVEKIESCYEDKDESLLAKTVEEFGVWQYDVNDSLGNAASTIGLFGLRLAPWAELWKKNLDFKSSPVPTGYFGFFLEESDAQLEIAKTTISIGELLHSRLNHLQEMLDALAASAKRK